MVTYFLFGKYSSDAIKGMSAGRTEKANRLIANSGGKVISVYALMGDLDLVIIATFPGTKQAVKASIAVSKLTGIAFTTSEAIPVEDFDKIISEL